MATTGPNDTNLDIYPFLLPVFEAIESFVELYIIPFYGGDLIVLHPSKSIDQMSTQARVDVIRCDTTWAWPILGPVGEVAYQIVGRPYGGQK